MLFRIVIIRSSAYNILCSVQSFVGCFDMEYLTAKEAAERWHISERRVQVLCQQGKIEGAKRLGWAWAIPREAGKPADGRSKKYNEIEMRDKRANK